VCLLLGLVLGGWVLGSEIKDIKLADRFAADSGSQVGSIRSANQGVFSISMADSVAGADGTGEGGGNADASMMKTVRVVATVDYDLVR
jgi:uncharacterized protein